LLAEVTHRRRFVEEYVGGAIRREGVHHEAPATPRPDAGGATDTAAEESLVQSPRHRLSGDFLRGEDPVAEAARDEEDEGDDALDERSRIPGAESSTADFGEMWRRSREVYVTLNKARHSAAVPRTRQIVPETDRAMEVVRTMRPLWCEDRRRLAVAALYMYDKRVSDMCERDLVHLL